MNGFFVILSQLVFLFLFILLGYFLSRKRFVPDNSHTVLSKMENYIFLPALVLGTFMDNFSLSNLSSTWEIFLGSFILAVIMIGISLLCVRFCSKDRYERNIYTYGLSFSNFGFMGNAVVSALFPDYFMEYLIFTLPLWILIYLWGVPFLLMEGSPEKSSILQSLKRFLNPMIICTIIGIIVGLTSLPVPQFLRSAISSAGNCMSPIAMLLTGMTIAQFNLQEILKNKGVYLVSALRLVFFPLLFLLVLLFFPLPRVFSICVICSLSMPLGLNTIIIPSALGRDTKVASGMALVSHVFSCVTIPALLMLFSIVLPA